MGFNRSYCIYTNKKEDYSATLNLAFEPKNDWRALIKANELTIKSKKKKKEIIKSVNNKQYAYYHR